jgi:hypothetical protein
MYQLSDLEKTKLITFNADKEMVEAVRKILLASIYSNGTLRKDAPADPLTNGALALVSMACSGRGTIKNEELGEDLRGLFHGIQLLENGLKKISEIKLETPKVENVENTAI